MSKIPQAEIIPLKTDLGALANRINNNTLKEHNKVDKTVSVKFAIALRDAKIYRQGLQGFYHVFKNVEILINQELSKPELTKTGRILKKFWRPEIVRTGPLEKDLMFFYDNDPSKFSKPIRSEQIEFVRHLNEAYEKNPHILLAYCHVMYLALFAGGRLMLSSLTRATGIFPQVEGKTTEEVAKYGTNLFRFDVKDDQTLRIEYKRDYELATRNELTEDEKLDIIEEAKEIYRRNVLIIADLEQHNRAKITGKLSYKAFHYGYYVLIALSVLAAFYFANRILGKLI